MLSYIRKISGSLRNSFHKRGLENLQSGDYFLAYNIPSFTQWESDILVDNIIKGEMQAKDDPLWKNTGAESPEEYESYSWQTCGIACLRMILEAIDPNTPYKQVTLAKEAETHGVYKKNTSKDPKANRDGFFHIPFLHFIEKFGLHGQYLHSLGDASIANYIMKQRFVIASVYPSIREESVAPNPKKGHLVLVVGFRIQDGVIEGFYINNPSGYSQRSQERYFVPIDNWRKVFSGSGDVIVYIRK